MEQSIEVGSIWIDKSGENPVIVLAHNKQRQSVSFTYLLTINGKLDLTEAFSSVDLFLKTKELMITSSTANTEYIKGKADGYNEGYQHGFTLAKEEITELNEQERQQIYYDGYDSGHNQWQNDYGFTIPNNTIKNLEATNYKKGLKDKAQINEAVKQNIANKAFKEGYAQAYSEIHAPTTERERQLQEKAWDEGYVSAIEDYLAQGDEFVGNVGCHVSCHEFGAVEDCEHTPNEETQEAMQAVLDKGEWKSTRCPDEGSEGFLKDYNIEGIREDKKHKYPHYFKNVSHLDWVDVYQINKLFPVKDDSDCILHARKKLLVCGGRGGGKDMLKDVKEAYDTLHRYLEIEGHLDD